jgi:hypothetical protein
MQVTDGDCQCLASRSIGNRNLPAITIYRGHSPFPESVRGVRIVYKHPPTRSKFRESSGGSESRLSSARSYQPLDLCANSLSVCVEVLHYVRCDTLAFDC